MKKKKRTAESARKYASAGQLKALRELRSELRREQIDADTLRTGRELIEQLEAFRAELTQLRVVANVLRGNLDIMRGELKQTGSAEHAALFWKLITERDELLQLQAIGRSKAEHRKHVADLVENHARELAQRGEAVTRGGIADIIADNGGVVPRS